MGAATGSILQDDLFLGWQLVDEGSHEEDWSKVYQGSIRITDYEQNTVIDPYHQNLAKIGAGYLAEMMTFFSVNAVSGGDDFLDIVPDGQLTDTEQRWTWITSGLTGYANPDKVGILKAWEDLVVMSKKTSVNKDLYVGARDFSLAFQYSPSILFGIFEFDILVGDHFDQPGKQ